MVCNKQGKRLCHRVGEGAEVKDHFRASAEAGRVPPKPILFSSLTREARVFWWLETYSDKISPCLAFFEYRCRQVMRFCPRRRKQSFWVGTSRKVSSKRDKTLEQALWHAPFSASHWKNKCDDNSHALIMGPHQEYKPRPGMAEK